MSVLGRAMGFMQGGGPRQYATWNPSDKGAGVTLSGGNLIWSSNAVTTALCRATLSFTVGGSGRKVQWEIHPTTGVATLAGISKSTASLSTSFDNDSNNWGMYSNDGKKSNGGMTAYGSAWSGANILTVAFDGINGTLRFAVDGVDQGIAFTGLTGTFFPSMGAGSSSTQTASANFGESSALVYPYAGYDSGAYIFI